MNCRKCDKWFDFPDYRGEIKANYLPQTFNFVACCPYCGAEISTTRRGV